MGPALSRDLKARKLSARFTQRLLHRLYHIFFQRAVALCVAFCEHCWCFAYTRREDFRPWTFSWMPDIESVVALWIRLMMDLCESVSKIREFGSIADLDIFRVAVGSRSEGMRNGILYTH
jgi:hypothetical protein